MRICINGLFLGEPGTGTGQYSLRLLESLAALEGGNAYSVLIGRGASRPAGLGAAVTYREVAGPTPWAAARKLYAEQVGFPWACRQARSDVAHVPYFAPPLAAPCPVVVTIHDLTTLLFPEYGKSPAARAYNTLVSAGARRCAAVIADSENSKRDIVRLLGIPQDRISVVYLAAESRFQLVVEAGELREVRRRYRLPDDFVLYVGGLNRHKNVGALLEAFAALRPRLPGRYSLAIAGVSQSRNPDIFPDLPALARKLGMSVRTAEEGDPEAQGADVCMLGFVPEADKPLLYNAARLFVFPSLYEGFGLPPLEAMACGTPVVCSSAASLPEVVGDGAILVDPRDVAGLTEAMHAVVTDADLAQRLRGRGLRQAARFRWFETARQTMRVYQQAAQRGTGR